MKKRTILVTGAHRSGTTWLGKIISRSPEVRYVHEPFNVGLERSHSPLTYWFEHVSDDSDPAHQRNVKKYLKSFYSTSLLTTFTNAFGTRSARDAYRFLRDLKSRVMRRTLIKDPIAIFSAEWMHKNIDCDVVITIRHPAAFTASLKVKNWAFGFEDILVQKHLMNTYLHAYTDTVAEYARKRQDIICQGALLWNLIYSTVRKYQEKYSNRWYFVRHEDLSINPLLEYQKIFEFLGLTFSDSIKNEIVASTTAIKSADLARNARENVRTWTTRLTPSEIALVKEQTRPVWKHYYSENEWQLTHYGH